MFPARESQASKIPLRSAPRSEAEQRELFETVYRTTYEPLQRYLRRRVGHDEAEEALDDVLLILWQKLPDLRSDQYLPWAYGVARRVLANRRRSIQRRQRLFERLVREPQPAAVEKVDLGDYPVLAAIFERLAEADQEVLRLWAWEGLEAQAIATVLGVTPNAASLRLSKSKRKLKKLMDGQDPSHAGHKQVQDDGEQRS